MEKYTLTVTKSEGGLQFEENATMSDFEILGILTHLAQMHSLKIQKELEHYEQSKRNTIDEIDGH